MTVTRLVALALFGVGVWSWNAGVSPPTGDPNLRGRAQEEFRSDPAARPADLERSACGCDAETGGHARGPSPAELNQRLAEFATAAAGSELEALEYLLFHREPCLELLPQTELHWVEERRQHQLDEELRRAHAWVALRIIDELGVVRTEVLPRRVPLGVKQHLEPDSSERLLAAEFSGRVERVGLNQLWARY